MLQRCKSNIYVINAILALAIWGIINAIGINGIYFSNEVSKDLTVFRILHLVFIYMLVLPISYLFNKYKEETINKDFLLIFLTYFILNIIILLLIWPGNFSWDDIVMLNEARYYGLTPWQHFFSGLFYIMCLQTLPFATGIIIIQVYIASIIVAYSISRVSYNYSLYNNSLRILLFVIMFFPPLLSYLYAGFRMGIYTYIEILFISYMLILRKKEKCSYKDIIRISCMVVILATWRTEAIYYIIAMPILFLLLGIKKVNRICILSSFILTTSLTIFFGKLNNKMIGNNNYSITATMLPMVELVRNADMIEDRNALNKIDKIINIQNIRNESESSSDTLYWEHKLVRDNYDKREFNAYIQGYLLLFIKYPSVAMKILWHNFIASVGMSINDGQTAQITNIEQGDPLYIARGKDKWREVKSKYKETWNLELRQKTLRLISGINREGKVTLGYKTFWNLSIPIGLGLLCFIYEIIRRRFFISFLILTILGRVPIVFLTSPSPYMMYYLPTYLSGYFISILIVYSILSKKNKNTL